MKSHDVSGSSLGQFTRFWWDELAKKVIGAVVFLDNASSECLHWNCGGALALFKAGAINIRELSSFESGGKDAKKAVFIVSGAVSGAAEMSVRDIILGSSFEHCIVVTAAPATVHPVPMRFTGPEHPEDDPNNLRAFVELERRLLRWMGSEDLTAEVLYCPLFAAQLLDDFFITPPFADFSPLLSNTKNSSNTNPHEKVIDKGVRKRLHHIAACLHSLLAFLGAREDIFNIGALGAALATELESLPAARARRKTAERRVALVLVDRSLDLATACSLDTSGCLLDRVLSVLPHFPGHSTERAVDMTPLCSALPEVDETLPVCVAPGCVLQPAGLVSLLESRSTKEGLMALQRRFLEVSPGSTTLRVTPDSLTKKAKALAQDGGIKKHTALLQLCLGVLQSLSGVRSTNHELLAGLQKVLVQNFSAGDEGRGLADVISQVMVLLKTRQERGLDVKSILLLLVQAFSLAGPDHAEHEAVREQAEKLQQVLSQALLQDGCDPWGEEVTEDTHASEIANDIVQRLFDIAKTRQILTKYKEILYQPSAQQAVEVRPLLPQLLADCLDPARLELGPDIHSTASGSLRSTLGKFLSAAKPHPCDAPLTLLIVLGGISGAELRSMRTISTQFGRQVLIGATSVSCPEDSLRYLHSMPS